MKRIVPNYFKIFFLVLGIYSPLLLNAQLENQLKGHEADIQGGRANRAFGAESFIGGGYKNTTDGDLSVVVGGQFNTTRADFTTIGGGYVNEVKGLYGSIPGGWWLRSASFGEVAVGYLNTIYAPLSTVSPHPKDRLFVIGNGNTEVVSAIETRQNRSDAFYILKGGDAMLMGGLFQAADTANHVNSSLFNPNLLHLRDLDVLSFKWEGSSGHRNRYDQQFGFNAAQVKRYYPQLVSTDGKGYMTVNYVGFIPLLVKQVQMNAVYQEDRELVDAAQDAYLEQLEQRINQYELLLNQYQEALEQVQSKVVELEKELSKSKEIEDE